MIIATRKEARDADHRTIATSNARSTPVTIHICTAYEKKHIIALIFWELSLMPQSTSVRGDLLK
jgi:hypothetical protein